MSRDAHASPVVRSAPAKLNLTLAVVGRRPDGFHELHSVFVPLALSDRLSVAPMSGGTALAADTLHVVGLDAGPVADNLVLRAIAAARGLVGEGPGPGFESPSPSPQPSPSPSSDCSSRSTRSHHPPSNGG